MSTYLRSVALFIILHISVLSVCECKAQKRFEGTYVFAQPSTKIALVLWQSGDQCVGSLYTSEKNKFYVQININHLTFTGTISLNNNTLRGIEGKINKDTLTVQIPDLSDENVNLETRYVFVKATKQTNFDPISYFNSVQNVKLYIELIGTWKLIQVKNHQNQILPLDHDGMKLMKDGQYTMVGGKASAEMLNKLNLKWYVERDFLHVKSEARPDLIPGFRFGKCSVNSDSLLITDDRGKVFTYLRR